MFIVTAIEDNDDRAFMLSLYNNYYRLVRKTIYGLTQDNKDIEDLINDVFIKLIEKIPTLGKLNSCKTTAYVVYTSRSVALNHLKHMNVIKKHTYLGEKEDISDNIISTDDNMEEKFFHQADLEALSNAILRLPQSQKDILYFKYILEMSDVEIAGILGISLNSVREYLARARRSAKKLMEKEMLGNGK